MTRSYLKSLLLSVIVFIFSISEVAAQDSGGEWYSLFDGNTLKGWKASENVETFKVKDGNIVANGPRSHLFYVGPVMDHSFKNFEFRADVKTNSGSNSGIYFHTEYQDTGWPEKGYEVQVNNTHEDPRKTGSLYAIDDVHKAPASDDQWFNIYIRVRDKRIVVKVDGKTVVDYTEPEETGEITGRVLSSGTFALQGHDPASEVYYKNIEVRPLKK